MLDLGQSITREDHPTATTNLWLPGRICACLAIVIGLIAMFGWTFGLAPLTQFLSARSAMQPMTALCAILSGGGVLLALGRKMPSSASYLVAVVLQLLALQTLLQIAFGVDFGTDRLFFPEAIAAQPVPYPFPGRMAAPTATAFLLIGTSLLILQSLGKIAGLVSSCFASAVLLLVTIALLGHLYMVAPLEGVLGFTQVSLPTAVALGCASIGVLTLRPSSGWVRLLVGGSIGATSARWLLAVLVLVPVAVAAFALRGSEAGLYPADFRLAFTTTVTIALLVALALWGTAQLDRLVAMRLTAEALQESEATLRAFFETQNLLASILERRDEEIFYLAANTALARLFGHSDLAGLSVRDVMSDQAATQMLARLEKVESAGVPLKLEECFETDTGPRWFAVTINLIADYPSTTPRFTIASLDITERKRAEAQQRLLLEELNHRVKNTLAVVQSLAHQSFKGDLADPSAKRAFESRLLAVSAAHSLLVEQNWKAVSVEALVKDVAGPGCGADRSRVDAEGPNVEIPPQIAVSLALALHELCTNAVKYGALSNETGRISISWTIAEQNLSLTWSESGGPLVALPQSRGFGSRLIERALSAELGRPVIMDFRPEYLVCMIEALVAPRQ